MIRKAIPFMVHILIIDKNIPFRQALAQIIDCKMPDICIEEASDSATGLEKMKTFLPPLVFLDIHLPGANNPEYIHILKHICPATTIIAFTSYDIPDYQRIMNQSGVDHFIPKDAWSGNEMLILIESIVASKENQLPPAEMGA